MTHYPPRLLTLVTSPATEPLTLAEVKLFLRVDGSEEDSLITRLLTAARETAESWLRRSLITQSWKLDQQHVGGEAVKLALGPVQSITEVTTLLKATTTTLTSSQYSWDATRSEVMLEGIGAADRAMITFVAGYGDASAVPAAIQQGILHQIAHLYHQREGGDAISRQAKQLWKPFQEMSL